MATAVAQRLGPDGLPRLRAGRGLVLERELVPAGDFRAFATLDLHHHRRDHWSAPGLHGHRTSSMASLTKERRSALVRIDIDRFY
jgi:hypothetical protein